MNPSTMHIEYANPNLLTDTITVDYNLETHNVARKWAASAVLANKKYSIDEPERFYGVDDQDSQEDYALRKINKCIEIINNYSPIVSRKLERINDQDTLNYLHHIFEKYHGLLNQQTSEFWLSAPEEVRVALSRLNTSVHRCEYVQRRYKKNHLVTWYSCPKMLRLQPNELPLFKKLLPAGTIFLSYSQIGKTLEALAEDNDQYISDEAFKPFDYYGPDFGVFLDDVDQEHMADRMVNYQKYYETHQDFFMKRGYTWEELHQRIGWIPLGYIKDRNQVPDILARPYVKSISFS